MCERFATSKLRQYDDLERIETFGFRGEALASISHVAHVMITSMTEGAPCAYRACYGDGHLVPPKAGASADAKPCAGTRGTQIAVEDMFYNAVARRNAMKGAGEEYGKVLQVVQSYAIDNAGVSMSCKKQGETTADLHTLREHGTSDVIRAVYGSPLAKELIALEGEETEIGLKVRGQLSNANFSSKKVTFLLFINKRLVESTVLRRAIEEVYSSYLPKGGHPFIYVSLQLPPESLDVNVHPTKREVHLALTVTPGRRAHGPPFSARPCPRNGAGPTQPLSAPPRRRCTSYTRSKWSVRCSASCARGCWVQTRHAPSSPKRSFLAWFRVPRTAPQTAGAVPVAHPPMRTAEQQQPPAGNRPTIRASSSGPIMAWRWASWIGMCAVLLLRSLSRAAARATVRPAARPVVRWAP